MKPCSVAREVSSLKRLKRPPLDGRTASQMRLHAVAIQASAGSNVSAPTGPSRDIAAAEDALAEVPFNVLVLNAVSRIGQIGGSSG